MSARRTLGRLRNAVIRLLVNALGAVSRSRVAVDFVGSKYGGWFVPLGQVKTDWVCYSVGAGEDISFDLDLIRATNCRVYSFDPTPRAAAFVASLADKPMGFTFLPLGIWRTNERMKFFAPRDPAHVSHSIVNIQNTDAYFEAECITLAEAMTRLGHSRIDLLKLDIEGAEHAVLQETDLRHLGVKVLCVEFDQPAPLLDMLRTLRKLRQAGYRMAHRVHWNYTFTLLGPTDASQPCRLSET